MGIRFFCPNGHRLKVKSFLAGKRGYCPHCGVKLLIPESTEMAATPEIVREPIVPLAAATTAEESGWYVRPPSGGQYGPATTEVIQQWVVQNRVPDDSLVWREGWPEWRPAADALKEVPNGEPESPLGISLQTQPEQGSAITGTPSARGRLRAAMVVILGLAALVLLATLLLIATART